MDRRGGKKGRIKRKKMEQQNIKEIESDVGLYVPEDGTISKSRRASLDAVTAKLNTTLPELCITNTSSFLDVKRTFWKFITVRSKRKPMVDDSPDRAQRYSGPPSTTHTAMSR